MRADTLRPVPDMPDFNITVCVCCVLLQMCRGGKKKNHLMIFTCIYNLLFASIYHFYLLHKKKRKRKALNVISQRAVIVLTVPLYMIQVHPPFISLCEAHLFLRAVPRGGGRSVRRGQRSRVSLISGKCFSLGLIPSVHTAPTHSFAQLRLSDVFFF